MADTELVDFIQHDHRIHHLTLFQRLHDFTRQSTYIRPAVTFDFRFIPHTADAEAVEGQIQTIGDRPAY